MNCKRHQFASSVPPSEPRARTLSIVMPAHHRPEHTLQHALRIQPRPRLAHPGHRIHHIPDPLPPGPQLIIQPLQHRLRLRVLAHLKELDADLPRRRKAAIEPPRRGQNHGLHVVRRLPVRDDDDVQRLDGLLAAGLELAQVRA